MNDKRLFPDDLAERFKDRAGKPYRPSNGTEGEVFMAHWCETCRHYAEVAFAESLGVNPRDCANDIIFKAMCHEPGEPEYPTQWQYGEDGQPRCTAHEPAPPQAREGGE